MIYKYYICIYASITCQVKHYWIRKTGWEDIEVLEISYRQKY